MPAFLQETKTGGHCLGVFQVHNLVDDRVVHGWGLCQQRGNHRHRDGDWVWLTKRWHHWYHCIRNPGNQEACTDQHCHLRTQSDRDRFVLSVVPLWAQQKCFLLLLNFSRRLALPFLFLSHTVSLNSHQPLWVSSQGCGYFWSGRQSWKSPLQKTWPWRWSWCRRRRWCLWGGWDRRKGWTWRSSGRIPRPVQATSPMCRRFRRVPGRNFPNRSGAWWPRKLHTATRRPGTGRHGGVLAMFLRVKKKNSVERE